MQLCVHENNCYTSDVFLITEVENKVYNREQIIKKRVGQHCGRQIKKLRNLGREPGCDKALYGRYTDNYKEHCYGTSIYSSVFLIFW